MREADWDCAGGSWRTRRRILRTAASVGEVPGMKTFGYCRVSGVGQIEGEGLPRQREAILKHGLPVEPTRGGAETALPEYAQRVKAMPIAKKEGR